MEPMTIGKLAIAAGVNVETVRYYQRRGLIEPPFKPPTGYRRYAPATVARIRFIKKAQELGFTLGETAELLALRVTSKATCNDVRQQATAKIESIAAKIQTLQRMQETLTDLVTACEAQAPTSECPILESLSTESGQ